MSTLNTVRICPYCAWNIGAAPHIAHPDDGSCLIPVVDRQLTQPPREDESGTPTVSLGVAKSRTREALAMDLVRALEILEACPNPRVVDGAPAFWEWFDEQAQPFVAQLRGVLTRAGGDG